ncbi:MAG TPA: biotin/lipoyl-containing protein, partial [Trebonia sp.]|nr:biotin/lipoyl-containing protein [Trebonia sp.]
MADFLLPDLGEGLSEAEVIAWRVSPGDRVSVDQVIAEVETAKAVVEVPVPYAGVVATLHATPGSVISVGQPLITVTEDAAADRSADGGLTAGGSAGGFREPGVVVPEQVPAAADGGEEASGSVLIGYGTTVAPARTRRSRRRAAAPSGPAPSERSLEGLVEESRRVAVISPLVRKEARDAGVDLTSLAGTGPDGVVSRQDVREAIAAQTTTQQRLPAADADASTAGTDAGTSAGPAGTGERRIPLHGARRAVADKLSRSRREIPEATVWVDVDATDLVGTRRALNAADSSR